MGTMLFIGLLAGLMLLMHTFKLGMRKVLGYDLFVDLLLTGGLLTAMAETGTASGVGIAIGGGLMLSITLYVLKQLYGYERLEMLQIEYRLFPGVRPINLPRIAWVYYPPRLFKSRPHSPHVGTHKN